MPIEAVKIPQNVYIEDRIIGPLSLRQIMIIAIGGGISYAIFGSIQRAYGSVPIPLGIMAWTPCAIASMFALVQFNDLSLLRMLFLLVERMNKNPRRTWTPRQGISIVIRTSAKPVAEVKVPEKKQQTQQAISELTSVLDRTWGMPKETAVSPAPVQMDDVPVASDPGPVQFRVPIEQEHKATADGASPHLSDLSVFRDIFHPPTA